MPESKGLRLEGKLGTCFTVGVDALAGLESAGMEALLGLELGEDFIELVNEMLATVNLFLLFLFLVLGESLPSKIRSSGEYPVDSSEAFVSRDSSTSSLTSMESEMLVLSCSSKEISADSREQLSEVRDL